MIERGEKIKKKIKGKKSQTHLLNDSGEAIVVEQLIFGSTSSIIIDLFCLFSTFSCFEFLNCDASITAEQLVLAIH